MRNIFVNIALYLTMISLSSCGSNIIPLNESPDNDFDRLTLAQKYLDDREYTKAVSLLEKVESDSNERRVLLVAANLGLADFSIWEIILNVLDSNSEGQKLGFDNIFNSVSGTIFGQDTKDQKVAAMQEAIELLLAAPEPDDADVQNLSCFLGGLLSVVAVEDGTRAITSLSNSLETISDNASGNGDNADECPGVSDLEASIEELTSLSASLTNIVNATAECSFIDVDGSSLNSVEEKIKQFTETADDGCTAVPNCGSSKACRAQSLGCVSQIVQQDDDSVAGDGSVSSCEMVQNCIGAKCF